jgi:hypothetical protein
VVAGGVEARDQGTKVTRELDIKGPRAGGRIQAVNVYQKINSTFWLFFGCFALGLVQDVSIPKDLRPECASASVKKNFLYLISFLANSRRSVLTR